MATRNDSSGGASPLPPAAGSTTADTSSAGASPAPGGSTGASPTAGGRSGTGGVVSPAAGGSSEAGAGVSPAGGGGRLDDLLAELAELAGEPDGADRAAVDALRARLAGDRLRVLVVGEAKRGKSTLVNALAERDLVPTGTLPVTALPTVIRRGPSPALSARYADGRRLDAVPDCLPDLVTEANNPDNRLNIDEVVLTSDAPALDPAVDLVDTPGVGSVFAHSSAAARQALDTMDAALFVLTADPPISGSERAFLTTVRDRAAAVFCVLNKADTLGPAERDEVVGFTKRVLFDALDYWPAVHPVSARQARAAQASGDAAALRDSGLPALRADLERYLRERHADTLHASVAGHAARVAARLLDRVTLTRRAARQTAERAGGQVASFRAQLTALDDYRRDAVDVAHAGVDRIRARLTDAATWDTPRLAAAVRDDLRRYLDEQRAGSPARREDDARAHTAAEVERRVDEWHRQWEVEVARELAEIDARLTAGLERALGTVRQAARELLDIELAVPVASRSVLGDVGVAYAFDEEIGDIPQWGSTLRHLPGRWGRRVELGYLTEQIDRLAKRQLGRVRAGLERALRPAADTLVRGIETRYAEATAGLVAAVDAADDLADSPDREARLDELAARTDRLDALTRRLRAVQARHARPAVAVAVGGAH